MNLRECKMRDERWMQDERRDSIDRGICFKIDSGWFHSFCIYVISLFGLQKVRHVRKIEGDIKIVNNL